MAFVSGSSSAIFFAPPSPPPPAPPESTLDEQAATVRHRRSADVSEDALLSAIFDRIATDDALQAELDALTTRVMQLAQTPFDTSTDFFIDVLDARAHGAELCLRAAQSALMHQGARGYLMSSDVQRRVRESHFVAIVTPAIKHLRKEIARLSTEEMPA